MEYEEEFEKEFAEWLKTRPQFEEKGEKFIEMFKEICFLWYMKGTKKGVETVITQELI